MAGKEQPNIPIQKLVLDLEEVRLKVLLHGIEMAREEDLVRENNVKVQLEELTGIRKHNPLD